MMAEVKDFEMVTIGAEQYKVVLLSTSRGLATSKQLIKLSLPTIGAGADGIFNDHILDAQQTFAQMAMLMVGQLDEVNIDALIKELLDNTTLNGILIDFDQHFKGRYEILIKLMEGALRANYGSLFTETSLNKKLKELIQTLNLPQAQMNENSEDQ